MYTAPGAANEYVIVASNFNVIRIIDGVTGGLVNSRTLDPPFISSDSQCADIPNSVGVTGTPIIDPATQIMYFFSKGYINSQVGPQGAINGQYKMYAVNLPSLTDVPGFPVTLNGHNALNDPSRYFVSGVVVQRTGLSMVGDSIIAGFSGHCDNFNYTGMLVTVSKTTGKGVTSVYAMMASPGKI